MKKLVKVYWELLSFARRNPPAAAGVLATVLSVLVGVVVTAMLMSDVIQLQKEVQELRRQLEVRDLQEKTK
jgi:hypothetical protein